MEAVEQLEFQLLDRRATPAGELVSYSVRIPPDLLSLQGHFPGNPVMPGTAQLLSIVLDRVRALWPELGEPRRVTRLKFKRTIRPGDPLEVRLDRGADEVHFELHRGREQCTVGTLVFAPATAL